MTDPESRAPAGQGGATPAFERARGFVEAHAGAQEQAMARALCGLATAVEVAASIEAELEPDGGLPGPDPEARLEATTRALRCIDQLGLLAHPVVESMARFLVAAQHDDGSFGAAADAQARVWLTAAVGAALSRVPSVRLSVLRAAEGFAMGQWDVEKVQGGGDAARATILATFELLAAMPSELSDEALQWCGRELERGFRTGAFSALEAARVFVRCGADALPGTRLGAADVMPPLLASQLEDGSFGDAERAPDERVHDTLDALVALSRMAGE
ncbi:MAG: hypothetical protein QNK05_18695 [Myxococcota bacterium]|nr:hypothetical protein [Myxococcota bacterium]